MALTTRQRIDIFLSEQDREEEFSSSYLDMMAEDAEAIVCHYRNTDVIEQKYVPVAAKIANYWIEKLGYMGASNLSENGVSRTYETGDIPNSLLRQITPVAVVID